jgi:hypothetical protein
MNETLQRIAPVLASILIIILIAVLRARSKTVAAITATMPVNVALGLWIVYVSEGGDHETVIPVVRSMFVGVAATAVWLLAVWAAARAGWGLPRLLLAGYAAWAVTIATVFALQSVFSGASLFSH